MQQKITLVSILILISLLALVAMFTGSYGYTTVALFGYPILFYSLRHGFEKVQWIILIITLLLVTVTSMNLLANLKGHLLYYYEAIASIAMLVLTLLYKPAQIESNN